MNTPTDFLNRLAAETKGMTEDDFVRHISAHVAIGIAFMRGAMGEDFTRDFMMAAVTAANNGTDRFTHPDCDFPIVLTREPGLN